MHAQAAEIDDLLTLTDTLYQAPHARAARMLAAADQAAVNRLRAELQLQHCTVQKQVRPYNQAWGLLLALTVVVGCVFTTQFSGSAATLRNIQGFPSLWVTTLVLLALCAVVYGLSRRVSALQSENLPELLNSLKPLPASRLPEFDRQVRSSVQAARWRTHVVATLGRDLCNGDLQAVARLVRADLDEGAADAKARLHGLAIPLTGEVLMVTALEQAAQKVCSSQDGALLPELMHASDAELAAKYFEVEALDKAAETRRKRFDPVMGFGFGCFPVSLVGFTPGCWQAYALSPAPMWARVAGYVGLAAFLCGLGVFMLLESGWIQERAATYNRRRERLWGLRELEGSGCYEMLDLLEVSEAARQWHFFVTQVRQRRYRWQDLYIARNLARRTEWVTTW